MACTAVEATAISIALVDDHTMVRDGLRRLLESETGISVVAEGATGRDVPAIVTACDPDVLLIDLCMPDVDGLEALRALRRLQHTTRPVLVAGRLTRQQTCDALNQGAVGLLLKSSPTELLFRCIRTVMAGEYWVTRRSAADLIEALRLQRHAQAMSSGGRRPRLSATEQRIVQTLHSGASNKKIARELGIAEQTVKNRLSQLYTRFSASNRLDLILKLTRMGLLPELPE